jgi:hypothetical protein
MKAQIKYYVYKDSINVDRFDVPLEFEVYGRVIKDGDGNSIQLFFKEDKANGLRRDSSFYWDGSWEVLEADDAARTIKSKTSLGVEIFSSHDSQWRVTSKIMTNKYNDTIAHNQYFWKNGRLVKTIFDGVDRIFVYGKTLLDTVKVIPSDEGVALFHKGYNNSVGMIPDENDPEYKAFLKSPYTVYGLKSKNSSFLQRGASMLAKYNETTIRVDEAVRLIYINPVLNACTDINIIYGYTRGSSYLEPELNAKCECDKRIGEFYVAYDAKPVNQTIKLYQSHVKYDTLDKSNPVFSPKKWQRYCVQPEELNNTYIHEMQHINNARYTLGVYADNHIPRQALTFSTIDLCETAMQEGKRKFNEAWDDWSFRELRHCNGKNNGEDGCDGTGRGDQRSPQQRPFKLGEPCDEPTN